MDTDECIFCFEKLSNDNIVTFNVYSILEIKTPRIKLLEDIDFMHFQHIIKSYNKYFTEMKRSSLTLECGHKYDYGCFLKYIKFNSTNVFCPLCRSNLKEKIIEILKVLDPLKLSIQHLESTLHKLYNKLFFEKSIMYFKKFFTKDFTYKRCYKFNNLVELYEDLEAFRKKVIFYTDIFIYI